MPMAPPGAIDKMVAQSEFVMNCGVCQVLRDPTVYQTNAMTLLLPPPVGARTILIADYNYIRAATAMNWDRVACSVMSERIKAGMSSENWSGSPMPDRKITLEARVAEGAMRDSDRECLA